MNHHRTARPRISRDLVDSLLPPSAEGAPGVIINVASGAALTVVLEARPEPIRLRDSEPFGTLGAHRDLWLRVACHCGRSACRRLGNLALEYGFGTRIDEAVSRMSCAACGSSAFTAELLDTPANDAIEGLR